MATTIVTKNGSGAPTASDLVAGELAVDLTNGRLYTEDSGGSVIEIGLNPSGNVDVTGSVTADGLTVQTTDGFSSLFESSISYQYLQFKNSGETNNYIGFINDDFVVTPANNQKMIVTAEGNVGIGTDSPSSTLHLSASAPIITLTDSDTGAVSSISASSGEGSLFIDADSGNAVGNTSMRFRTDGSEAMRIDASGNVGIGVTAPTRALSVFGDTAGVISITSNSTDGISSLSFGDTADDNAGRVNYLNASDDMLFYTATAERMRIDASGNLLVGRTSRLTSQVKSISSDTVVSAHGSLTSHQTNAAIIQYTSDEMILRSYGATAGTGEMVFKTGGGGGSTDSEAMRIDSSGNLLVGKTSDAINVAGVVNYNAGIVRASRNGNSGQFGRISTDGDILTFYKDTVTVGSIGSKDGDIAVGTGDTGFRFIDGSNAISPHNISTNAGRDAAIDLGTSGGRFKDLYLSGDVNLANNSQITFASTSCNIEGNSAGADFIKFTTGNNEAARFDSSGNLLLGTTSVINTGVVSVEFTGASQNGISIKTTTASNGSKFLSFADSAGTEIGYIEENTSTSVNYSTSSDQRLKDNIVDAPSASDDIDAIQVRSFDWKANGSHQKYGMVAQELQTVAPEAVSGDADSEDMMGVDYSKLVPMMLKEIQSLRARVAQLES